MSDLSDLLRDLEVADQPAVETPPEAGVEDLFVQARAAIGRRDLSPATRRFLAAIAAPEVGAWTHPRSAGSGARSAPQENQLACPWVEPGNLGIKAHTGAERPKVEYQGSCVQVWVTAPASAGAPDLVSAVAANLFVPP